MKKMSKILISIVLLLTVTSVAFPATAKFKLTWSNNPDDYIHGIPVEIDGQSWYFVGPGSIEPPDNVTDIPGHTWKQVSEYHVKGYHYNVGPHMVPAGTPWWATDESYGILLFVVDCRIAPYKEEIVNTMAQKGYIHYHELVDSDGDVHPELVAWLKHTAARDFTFDGGPEPTFHYDHEVYRFNVD